MFDGICWGRGAMKPGETRVKFLMKSSQNEGNKIFPNHLQEIWNIPLLFVKSTLLLTTKLYRGETTHPLYGTRLNSAGETFGGDCNLNFRCSEDEESCVKRDRPRGLYVNLARKRYLRRKQCSQQPWKQLQAYSGYTRGPGTNLLRLFLSKATRFGVV